MLKELFLVLIVGTSVVQGGVVATGTTLDPYSPTACEICKGFCNFVDFLCVDVPDVLDCAMVTGQCHPACEETCLCEENCPIACEAANAECSFGEKICHAKQAFCTFQCRISCPSASIISVTQGILKQVGESYTNAINSVFNYGNYALA